MAFSSNGAGWAAQAQGRRADWARHRLFLFRSPEAERDVDRDQAAEEAEEIAQVHDTLMPVFTKSTFSRSSASFLAALDSTGTSRPAPTVRSGRPSACLLELTVTHSARSSMLRSQFRVCIILASFF